MEKKVTHKREKDGAITHLKVDDVEKTKEYVLKDILENDYYTYVDDKKCSKIHKESNYLTTNPNDKIKDNLDNLPNF